MFLIRRITEYLINPTNKDWEKLNELVESPDSDGYITFPPLPFKNINMQNISQVNLKSNNNDNYKFSARMELPMTVFAVGNKENAKDIFTGFTSETYEEYKANEQTRKDRQTKKDSWIYAIINKEKEQEDIKAEDDDIIIMNGWNWDSNFPEETLRFLIIYKDTTLDTVRDLTADHIPMLKRNKETIEEYIKTTYPKVNLNRLRYYFHYSPTTYQLHMHVLVLSRLNTSPDMAYCHMLETVINNLTVFPDYYQKVDIIKRDL